MVGPVESQRALGPHVGEDSPADNGQKVLFPYKGGSPCPLVGDREGNPLVVGIYL